MLRRAQHQFSSFKGGVKGGFLIILLLSLFACEEKPDGLLSKGEMEDVLYDYHIAQYMAASMPYEERYKSYLYVEAVFEKHGITEAQFDSSLVYYNRHTAQIRDIYQHVQRKLERAEATKYAQVSPSEAILPIYGQDTA